MQVTHRFLPLVLVAGVSLTTGCGYLQQARDNSQPQAVPAMQMAQTLNPEAGKNRKVVAGLDGAAAKNVNEAYAKSFQQTEKAADAFQGMSGLKSD